jgi:hypothetical protein
MTEEEEDEKRCEEYGCPGTVDWDESLSAEGGDSTPPPYRVGRCGTCGTCHLECGECGNTMYGRFGGGSPMASFETVEMKCGGEGCEVVWAVTYEKGEVERIEQRRPNRRR